MMEQSPLTDKYNPGLLQLMRKGALRVIEVGSNSGALARAYRSVNPDCQYTGIEIDPRYAEASGRFCSDVICCNIESFADDAFAGLFPSDCWIFGDVLEHLYDPWALLRRIRAQSSPPEIVACIPNSQHWSMQVSLNNGELFYQRDGLLDRTHIRFFTRLTMNELFESSGYRVVESLYRGPEKPPDAILSAIRELAVASGADPQMAVDDAMPYQWILKAVPI